MSGFKSIGFIGGGNMGEAMLGALIHADLFKPERIGVSDISEKRLDYLSKTYGIKTYTENKSLFTDHDIILLAVKPQQMDDVLRPVAELGTEESDSRKLIISIAAGIKIEKIEAALYSGITDEAKSKMPIIRVMPNTPALVLSGMSGMSPNSYAQEGDIKITKTILESMGAVKVFDESYLDAVTALSGSGPAYLFYLAEAMTKGGIQAGIPADDAAEMAFATIEGAVKLMKEKKETPEALRKKVTSPGGTTEAAIRVMDENNVKDSIIKAILAACQRSRELS